MTEQESSSEEKRIEQEIVEIPEVQDVLRAVEGLPPEAREHASEAVLRLGMQVTMTQERYVSPIPPARVMAEYEALQPGCTDRFLTQAEEQGRHRRRLEEFIIRSDKQRELRGQVAAFTLALVVILGGFWLLSIGLSAFGIAAIVTPAIALAGAFHLAQRQKQAELKARAEAIEKPPTPTPSKYPQLPKPPGVKSKPKSKRRRRRY